jgi:hypothetical protein
MRKDSRKAKEASFFIDARGLDSGDLVPAGGVRTEIVELQKLVLDVVLHQCHFDIEPLPDAGRLQ